MTKNLKSVYSIFPKESDCLDFLEEIIWNGNVRCPYCGQGSNIYAISKLNDRYHCNGCNTSFSVTVKTIFARTRCDLRKWFFAIYILYYPKNKISVREIANQIETTKDTALLLRSKIDSAKIESPNLLTAIFEKIENS